MKRTFLKRLADAKKAFTRGLSGGAGSYDGGAINRLNGDWVPSVQTADAAIRNDLRLMRARCRELERDEEYVRKYLSVMTSNVLGHDGISLEMKIENPDGTPDTLANKVIQKGWDKWCEAETCTVNEEDDFIDVQELILRSVLRDGGILIRKHIGKNLNDFGFSIQLMEIDYLDINYSTHLPNGNLVFMGVEKNPNTAKVVGYWLLQRHPGETFFGAWPYSRYFVPANELLHIFIKERTTQSVGVPMLAAPMTRLNMLRGYEAAELAASREAAVKGGFFRSSKGETYTGPKDEDGNTLDEMSPGQKTELPPGMDFIKYDPTHPMSQYPDHVKAQLHGVSAGLELSYSSLTGDLSEVNFSSGRMGWLEEREMFKRRQSFMIRKAILPVFKPWLEAALLQGALEIKLPFSKFDKLHAPACRGRRWSWVDPVSDVQAALAAINGGLETRTQHIEEHQDRSTYEETIARLAYEKELADEAGITFTDPSKGGQTPPPSDEQPAKTKPKPKVNGENKSLLGIDRF